MDLTVSVFKAKKAERDIEKEREKMIVHSWLT